MTDEDGPPGNQPDESTDDDGGMTYAGAGVDIEASEAATAALVSAVEGVGGDYAGFLDIGDRYLALTTDGVGTKLLVAGAIEDYTTIGIDCIAMNVNDLVAAGVRPVAFVDYLAVESPEVGLAEQIGQGLDSGCDEADVELLAGETAVMPDVIRGFDLAGTAAGLAPKEDVFAGDAHEGDALVGFPSSGVHSNGLTLARKAATKNHDYTDPFPPNPSRTIGQELLQPTRIYTYLLDAMVEHDVHAAAHVTGGGWTNLSRMGDYRYDVSDPLTIPEVFDFIQDEGSVADAEMYRTFNMGLGFVAAADPEDAEALAANTDGEIVGHVEAGDSVSVRGLEL